MGETENNVAILLTATNSTPEAALIVATLTGGGQQDVVEGSFETGIESLQYSDVFPTKEIYCSSFW